VFYRLKQRTLHLISVGCPTQSCIKPQKRRQTASKLKEKQSYWRLVVASDAKSIGHRAWTRSAFTTRTQTRWTNLVDVLETINSLKSSFPMTYTLLQHKNTNVSIFQGTSKLLIFDNHSKLIFCRLNNHHEFWRISLNLVIISFLHSALLFYS